MNPLVDPQFNADPETGEAWLESIGDPPMPMGRLPLMREGQRWWFAAFGKKVWLNQKDNETVNRFLSPRRKLNESADDTPKSVEPDAV